MQPNQLVKLGAVGLVVAAVVVILLVKQAESDSRSDAQPVSIGNVVAVERPERGRPDPSSVGVGGAPGEPAGAALPDTPSATAGVPKLIDLGAGKCIPCKKMAPILEALREDFAGRFDVIFIDVWKNRQAAVPYKIRVIPTQIFFDEDGNELFRHEGFFSRQDILGTWTRLGYPFSSPQADDEAGAVTTAAPSAEPAGNVAEAAGPSPRTVMAEPHDRIIAYYFHWTTRCHTCLEIEKYSRNVMIETFGDELEAGRLEWHAHNMELPEYEHFQKDFDLSTPSLVLVRLEDGVVAEWKVLGAVWDLIETPADLEDYVRAGTRAYLALGPG